MKHLDIIFTISFTVVSHMAFSQSVNEAIEPPVNGPEVIDLIEGGTLEAWKVPSDNWKLEGESVIGSTGEEGLDIPEWLYTKQQFGDFVFTCELQLTGL